MSFDTKSTATESTTIPDSPTTLGPSGSLSQAPSFPMMVFTDQRPSAPLSPGTDSPSLPMMLFPDRRSSVYSQISNFSFTFKLMEKMDGPKALGSKMDSFRENLADRLRSENTILREFLAELLGTFFLLLIGTSANVQNTVAPGGNSTSAHLAWGFGFAFAVYIAANVSGAHLNPAISLTQYILGNIPFPKVIIFSFAQLIGAFLGTAVTFVGHLDDINTFDGGNRSVTGPTATAGWFATYPSAHMTWVGSFFDQVIGTAILSGCVVLITDKRHRIPQGVVPFLAGTIMSMIAMTYGANGGFAINPARDLGPRLFTLVVGYGWEVFSAYNYYFWIPIVGPFVGAIIGAWIYKLLVGLHGLNEDLDITGGKPYPRDDRGYKGSSEYSSNTSTGLENLVSYTNLPR